MGQRSNISFNMYVMKVWFLKWPSWKTNYWDPKHLNRKKYWLCISREDLAEWEMFMYLFIYLTSSIWWPQQLKAFWHYFTVQLWCSDQNPYDEMSTGCLARGASYLWRLYKCRSLRSVTCCCTSSGQWRCEVVFEQEWIWELGMCLLGSPFYLLS